MTTLLPISVEGISVKKRGKRLIGPLSVSIETGGPTVVIGPNGAGKTTLLRAIHGLDRVSGGRVRFEIEDKKTALQKQCFVFQRPIMLRRSALENVAYPLILRGVARKDARERAEAMLTRVGLAEQADTRAPFLSGGEAQKLAIARALVTDPELLILDEPTASLDGTSTQEIENLIREASESGIDILMTTHDMGQARRLAARIIFLHKGEIRENTEAKAFWEKPQSVEAERFVRGEII